MASHNESRTDDDETTDERGDSMTATGVPRTPVTNSRSSGDDATESERDPDETAETTLERVERIARRVIDLLSGSQIDLESYDPGAHGSLFAFDEGPR